MKKMLFFVNPNAGHTEIRGSLMEVLQIFTRGGYEVTVHPTRCPRDLTEQIAERGSEYDLIVCTGGDGTLNEAVSGLMELKDRPPLGYIATGTVNDMAYSLGLPTSVEAAAQAIVNGKPFPIDVGCFCGRKWFDYVAAFGLFTDVPYDTPQEGKRVLGKLAYLLSGAKALGAVKPIHVVVECENEVQDLQVLDGLVCSTTSVGGLHAAKPLGVSLNDGRFEVVLVRNFKSVADFNTAAACILRGEFPEPYFLTYQTGSVRFHFDEPVSWTLDGEYGGTVKDADITNFRRAIDIMVPN